MPLDLINIGAEANDGTGDTPRAAGQKINAAIAALNDLPASTDYSADIAAIEAVQGSQAAAILALESDVADLQAAPASPSGWDYIGPTEPIAPPVGFTWWEKVSGATVGRWEWSGAEWRSTTPFSVAVPVSVNSAFPRSRTGLLVIESVDYFGRNGAVAIDSNNYPELRLGVRAGASTSLSIPNSELSLSSFSVAADASFSYGKTINTVIPSPRNFTENTNDLRTFRTLGVLQSNFGSFSAFFTGNGIQATVNFREVRA